MDGFGSAIARLSGMETFEGDYSCTGGGWGDIGEFFILIPAVVRVTTRPRLRTRNILDIWVYKYISGLLQGKVSINRVDVLGLWGCPVLFTGGGVRVINLPLAEDAYLYRANILG